MLPGAADASSFWAPIIERLPTAWHVQAIDLPGLGSVPAQPDVPQGRFSVITGGRWLPMAVLLVFMASAASGQGSPVTPAQATAFMGTWVIDMTEPAEFKGTQTLRIWDRNGAVAASVQSGKSPVIEVTGIVKDGNMLVLTISRDGPRPVLENGAPIWAVYALTLEGDTMKVALMLEQSRTIKRGMGKKQTN
jgi:hypothetical protein